VVRSYEGEFLSARSAQRSHVGLDPGLVDEDEALRIKTGYQRSISGSMPILLTTKTGRSFKKAVFRRAMGGDLQKGRDCRPPFS
jgi:hypothetical protein